MVLLQLCIVQLLRITATGVNLQIVGIAPVHILLEKHLLVPSVYLSSVVWKSWVLGSQAIMCFFRCSSLLRRMVASWYLGPKNAMAQWAAGIGRPKGMGDSRRGWQRGTRPNPSNVSDVHYGFVPLGVPESLDPSLPWTNHNRRRRVHEGTKGSFFRRGRW